jgi:hypothetical protein
LEEPRVPPRPRGTVAAGPGVFFLNKEQQLSGLLKSTGAFLRFGEWQEQAAVGFAQRGNFRPRKIFQQDGVHGDDDRSSICKSVNLWFYRTAGMMMNHRLTDLLIKEEFWKTFIRVHSRPFAVKTPASFRFPADRPGVSLAPTCLPVARK